jgi:hypothetical protein
MNTLKSLAIVLALTGAPELIYGNISNDSDNAGRRGTLTARGEHVASGLRPRGILFMVATTEVAAAGILLMLIGLKRMRREASQRYY